MKKNGSLNHIFRLVWSHVLNAWIAVAENTKARGKGKQSGVQLVAAALSLAALLCALPPALAGPTGGQVISGTASINQNANVTTINQSSNTISLNWNSFNIAPQDTVNFIQPSTTSIAVNHILGNSGSQILGHLNANGEVFLINPNGILFGQGAQVNVGSLVASALDFNDANLANASSSLVFAGKGTGSVINQGTIVARQGGFAALLGNSVSNQGRVTAQLGTVALGAGSAVTLTFSDNSLLHLQVDQSTLNNLAANGGLIQADGGLVIMTAGAKDALLASMVNNTGVLEAQTVSNKEGTISLVGGMTAGSVNVAGVLDASASQGGNGGFIETSAAQVHVADNARITTASSMGLAGTWLIDPQDFTVAAVNGDISGAALSGNLNNTSITLDSSNGSSAGSGNLNINDSVTWSANTTLSLVASNNVNINANIAAHGATAGLVISPNTTNTSVGGAAENASGSGVFNLGAAAAITLDGANPTLTIAGNNYTVINAANTGITGLQNIQNNLSGYYALGSDIDASATAGWNVTNSVAAGFVPIGSLTSAFVGTLDGLGHSISNLTINLPNSTSVGLFGLAGPGSVIQNIGVVNATITGNNEVGALAGSSGGRIINSFSSGAVTNISDTVGGLVGVNYGTISNSSSSATVSGYSTVGGLVGNNFGALANSNSTGKVSGTSYVGGLAGQNYGTINNSYSTSVVSGSYTGGGLVGRNLGVLNNSTASGAVTGSNYVGGLVGGNYGPGVISNSSSSGAVGTAGASISTAGGLVGKNYGGATITTSHSSSTVNAGSGSSVGGLVGSNFGLITDSYAVGHVSGNNYVGGLAGYNSGTITNSYAIGSVGGNNYVGGLVGMNYGTLPGHSDNQYSPIVSGSFATGSVTGNSGIGGLVGSNYGPSSIANSYSTGAVVGTANVGGLVGYNDSLATIANSYTVSPVNNSVAGASTAALVGLNAGTVTTSFWNTDTNGAAMVGVNNSAGASNNPNSGSSTAATGTIDAISAGVNTAAMMSANTFAAWNTAAPNTIATTGNSGAVWRIYDGNTMPLLDSFLIQATISGTGNPSLTYNGNVQTGSLTLSGLQCATLSGATCSTNSSLLMGTVYGTGTVNVGTYAAGLGTYSSQFGYDISLTTAANSGALTIVPATLTYVANAATAVAGATPTGFTGTVTGLLNGQTLAEVANGNLVWNTPAGAGSTPGSYAIEGSGLTAQNYLFVESLTNDKALTLTENPVIANAMKATPTIYAAVFNSADLTPGVNEAGERPGDDVGRRSGKDRSSDKPDAAYRLYQVIDGGIKMPGNS